MEIYHSTLAKFDQEIDGYYIDLPKHLCESVGLSKGGQMFSWLMKDKTVEADLLNKGIKTDLYRLFLFPKKGQEELEKLYLVEVNLKNVPGSTAAVVGFLTDHKFNIEYCQAIDAMYGETGRVILLVDAKEYLKEYRDVTTEEGQLNKLKKLNQTLTETNFDIAKLSPLSRDQGDNIYINFEVIYPVDFFENKFSTESFHKDIPTHWTNDLKAPDNGFILLEDRTNYVRIKINKKIEELLLRELADGRKSRDVKNFFVGVIANREHRNISMVFKDTKELIIAFLLTMENKKSYLYQVLAKLEEHQVDLRIVNPVRTNVDEKKVTLLIAGDIRKGIYKEFSLETLRVLFIADLLFNNRLAGQKGIAELRKEHFKITIRKELVSLINRDNKTIFNLMLFNIYQCEGDKCNFQFTRPFILDQEIFEALKNDGLSEGVLEFLGYTQKNDHSWDMKGEKSNHFRYMDWLMKSSGKCFFEQAKTNGVDFLEKLRFLIEPLQENRMIALKIDIGSDTYIYDLSVGLLRFWFVCQGAFCMNFVFTGKIDPRLEISMQLACLKILNLPNITSIKGEDILHIFLARMVAEDTILEAKQLMEQGNQPYGVMSVSPVAQIVEDTKPTTLFKPTNKVRGKETMTKEQLVKWGRYVFTGLDKIPLVNIGTSMVSKWLEDKYKDNEEERKKKENEIYKNMGELLNGTTDVMSIDIDEPIKAELQHIGRSLVNVRNSNPSFVEELRNGSAVQVDMDSDKQKKIIDAILKNSLNKKNMEDTLLERVEKDLKGSYADPQDAQAFFADFKKELKKNDNSDLVHGIQSREGSLIINGMMEKYQQLPPQKRIAYVSALASLRGDDVTKALAEFVGLIYNTST